MAEKTTTQLINDRDGTVVTESGAMMMSSIEGVEYEVDLGIEHAAALLGALAPYIAAGRKAAGGRRGQAPRPCRGLRRAARPPSAATRAPGFVRTGTRSVSPAGSPPS
jgi:hypothetical protein